MRHTSDEQDPETAHAEKQEEDEISTRDLTAALQVADAHPEMVEYVRRADERGGTGITNSLRTFYRSSGVETMEEIGSNLEKCLWKGGARAVLNHELPGISIDTTNEEILRAIDDEATEDEEETREVRGVELPTPLADFAEDDLSGLFAVRPESEGVLYYSSCSRVGDRPAVEIPFPGDSPHIVDESKDAPPEWDVQPPGKTFDQLVREYGLTYEVRANHAYVYVPEGGR